MTRPYPLLLLISIFSSLFISCGKDEEPQEPADYYESVTIDNRQWMVKNLDVVTYRNGDPIEMIADSLQWVNTGTGAYCSYNNDSSLTRTYGLLYNWHAVNDSRELAPKGWHIATNSEWQALINHLGGVDEAGGKLKEAGLAHWVAPNAGADNSSGYTALPGGFRSETDGTFTGLGGYVAWWLNESSSSTHAYSASLSTITGKAYTSENTRNFGAYIRCVKD